MENTFTPSGFPKVNFKDFYGKDCTIVISSIIEPHCIWFGIEGDQHMHISAEQLEALLPVFQKFIKYRELY